MSSPSSPEPARWEKLGRTLLTHTRIFDVFAQRFRHPGRGREGDFVVIDAPDWVNVIAVTSDGRLVLVRQYRFGIDRVSLEIPGGVMEAGEDPVEAGGRELREETGYSGEARLLGSVHPNPAMQNNRCHFVLVENAAATHPLDWDPDEELAVELRPVDEVLALARSGGITHGLVLNALLFFEPVWAARQAKRCAGL